MPTSDSEQYDLLDRLAEEFADRFRRGERPALKEYTDRYPELADDIRELFPAMVKVEQVDEGRSIENVKRELADRRGRCSRSVITGSWREIGRGGMGVVYEAEQVSLGRRVALKVLPRHVAADRMTLERFRREARAAARLHHTNIVPVFEVGQDGDVRFYAMQFIQGQSLDAVITELRHLRIQSQSRASGEGRPRAAPGSANSGPVGRPFDLGGRFPAGRRRPRDIANRRGADLRQKPAERRPCLGESRWRSMLSVDARPARCPSLLRDSSSTPTPALVGRAAGGDAALGRGVEPSCVPSQRGPHRQAGRDGAGSCACPRRDPSRHQAVEPPARYRRRRLGDRLRAGQGRRRWTDPDRRRPGHDPLHGARAIPRPG